METPSYKTGVALQSKRKFPLEAQRELCLKWNESGIGKREFCRRNNLGISTFYGWCRKILPKLSTQKESSNWAPVITTKKRLPLEQEESEQAIIELSLPNHIVARVRVSNSKVASFIQEVCHAVATIR